MCLQGAKELAKGLRVHTSLTDLSLAENPLRTEGLEHICQALAGLFPWLCVFLYLLSRLTMFWRRLYREFACADGNCPLFTLNIRNTQVIRLPLCIQETKMLKEIVSEDNPLLFPPREVQQMRVRRVLACMSVCN